MKLHSVLLQHEESDFAPQSVKLFVNQPYVGFDEASSSNGTQSLLLEQNDATEGTPTALKYVKFQKVRNVTLFIESNCGDEDVTRYRNASLSLSGSTPLTMYCMLLFYFPRLSKHVLFGTPEFTTNMNDWEKACKT